MSEPESSPLLWLTLLTLSEQATRDHLTGLHNRRYFEETLADHVAAATRYDRPLTLILLDIDRFKEVNDTLGHDAGDAVLRQFAALLVSTARQADMVFRYGGDEFAVLLPETGKADAMQFVTRLREAAEASHTADTGNAAPPSFTAGLASLPCPDLVAAADTELLARKRESRPPPNR